MRPKALTMVLMFFSTMAISAFLVIVFSCSDKNNPTTPDIGPKLILSLDPTLDRAGEMKADSIANATLVDTDGLSLKTAVVSDNKANFDLSGINIGDYFIVVNGFTQDKVPTRIADTTRNILQSVGKNLTSSLIVMGPDTLFRTETFFSGQGQHPVRRYSDGTNVVPEEYAYAILSFKADSQRIEIRVDSTAALLTSEANPNHGPHQFVTWMLGETNHGIGPAGDPDSTSAQCRRCHAHYDIKPAQWSDITTMNGLCFKCHYGSGGASVGMVNPTK